jgi:hypothetical protein
LITISYAGRIDGLRFRIDLLSSEQQNSPLAIEHITPHIVVMTNNIKMPTARDIYPVSPGAAKAAARDAQR